VESGAQNLSEPLKASLDEAKNEKKKEPPFWGGGFINLWGSGPESGSGRGQRKNGRRSKQFAVEERHTRSGAKGGGQTSPWEPGTRGYKKERREKKRLAKREKGGRSKRTCEKK